MLNYSCILMHFGQTYPSLQAPEDGFSVLWSVMSCRGTNIGTSIEDISSFFLTTANTGDSLSGQSKMTRHQECNSYDFGSIPPYTLRVISIGDV